MLRARATVVGPWERFTLCYHGAYWTLRSNANGKYVSAELGYGGALNGVLRARATVVGPWEKFTFSQLWARSDANGKYVSAELGYGDALNGVLRARATVLGPWEKFWGAN